MTPHASAAAWRRRARPRGARVRRSRPSRSRVLGARWSPQYLAGFLFLWSLHLDPRAATPLTIARYAYYYGDRRRPQTAAAELRRAGWRDGRWRARLALSLPRRRSLHGDARFATRREIARAGLLASRASSWARWGAAA